MTTNTAVETAPEIIPREIMNRLFMACSKNERFKISGCKKTIENHAIQELKLETHGKRMAIKRFAIDPHSSAGKGIMGDHVDVVTIVFQGENVLNVTVELAGYLPVLVSNDDLPKEIETLSRFLETSGPFDTFENPKFIKFENQKFIK